MASVAKQQYEDTDQINNNIIILDFFFFAEFVEMMRSVFRF